MHDSSDNTRACVVTVIGLCILSTLYVHRWWSYLAMLWYYQVRDTCLNLLIVTWTQDIQSKVFVLQDARHKAGGRRNLSPRGNSEMWSNQTDINHFHRHCSWNIQRQSVDTLHITLRASFILYIKCFMLNPASPSCWNDVVCVDIYLRCVIKSKVRISL